MKKKVWVDPPSGHKYGFPKLWNPNKNPDMWDWIVKEGYPQRLLTPSNVANIRYWYDTK